LKMVILKKTKLALLFVYTIHTCVNALWNFNLETDLRYLFSDFETHEVGIYSIGGSVRKTFSDNSGDRLTLFTLFEAKDNFRDFMIHELHMLYKGPMGIWKITGGRFGLPYGLLSSFSTSRLLYNSAISNTLGFDVDNGLMLSGLFGMFDYGVALTQGYGPHHTPKFPGHGLLTTRLGIVFGDALEYSVGLSAIAGKTQSTHHEDGIDTKYIGGIDATALLGQTAIRLEFSGGQINRGLFAAAFASVDYALLSKLDITAAINLSIRNQIKSDSWFIGFSFRPGWFTLRGGYTYEYFNKPDHRFSFQLYHLFSYSL